MSGQQRPQQKAAGPSPADDKGAPSAGDSKAPATSSAAPSASSSGTASQATVPGLPLTAANASDAATAKPTGQRRPPNALPGLSSTASSIRRQSSNLASGSAATLRRASSGRLPDEQSGLQDPLPHSVDQEQLDELRKGIIMPGLGGARAAVEAQPGSSAQQPTDAFGQGKGKGSTTDDAGRRGRDSVSGVDARIPAASAIDLPPPPSRSRAQPTLKASMLKKRVAAPKSMGKAVSSSKSTATQSKMGQGTPARATRYSLPVRAEKPVRTSKVTGKHVVLPSESQLAPLPDEEGDDDDDDEDDDDDDDDSSSEDDDEEDIETASRADDELVEDLDEEEREKAREARRLRREEAQQRLEEARKEREAKRQARKPKGILSYPGDPGTSEPAKAGQPGYRGPAHARAPPRVPKSTGPVFHTFERLAPTARLQTSLPRLTSYAIAPAIHIPSLIGFLRREHGVRPRLYDECAYVVYFKPLLPGFGRAEVRSAPEPRHGSPGAETRREREIVEREESGYVGNYFAATNREDDAEAMDEHGYIIGGEGRGKEEDEEEQAQRRRQQDKQANAGEMTETETEREGVNDRIDSRAERAAEYSETDGEADREPVIDEERSPLLDLSDVRSTGAFREDIDGLESGLQTPKALQPRRDESTDDEYALQDNSLDQIDRRQASETGDEAESQYPLSNADVAGARDLRDQQSRIESGEAESAEMPAMRSAGESDREEDGYGRRERHHSTHDGALEGFQDTADGRPSTPSRNGTGLGINSHSSARRNAYDRERDEQRALRQSRRERRKHSRRKSRPNMASHNHDCSRNLLASRAIQEALHVAELVILPYGVLVMYNMSAAEERSVINDVVSSGCLRGGPPYGPDDEETEAFHFCYDPSVPAPRIFNDFFTFRASNHLLKLSLAHAIAQSTRLSVFEESMQQTLELTSHIPKELAGTGELRLKRREALKLTGRLFKLRVDVNLTSNVLDTPELFWSEASLKALYDAIREYLEIDQRVENLNERLAVGNDLLEVIHDHLGSQSMNQITWIIIVLIVVACFVACGEIAARLILHGRSRSAESLLRKATPDQLLEAFVAIYQVSQQADAGVPARPGDMLASSAQTVLGISAA